MKSLRSLAQFGIVLILAMQAVAQTKTEKELIRVSTELDHSVIALMDWGDNFPAEMGPGVVGSAFLVNDNGYFITAAHVLADYRPNSGKLVAVLRQTAGGGGGQWFDIVDKDDRHDLALCKIVAFNPQQLEKSNKMMAARKDIPPDSATIVVPWSLPLSGTHLVIGNFVAIGGFPLGSWNPSIQMGHIAATKTINPSVGGGRDLFQVSVAGNQGDSGGPVVDLHTGAVVGVVVRGYIQLHPEKSNVIMQSSGIVMAAPVAWVNELLTKNNIRGTSARHSRH